MLEEKLKEIWKNSAEKEQIKFDFSRLFIDLNSKMDVIEKGIKRRDIAEISASVFGIIMFSYFTYEIPFPVTKIACILSVIWFCYVIYKLKHNKKLKLPADLTLSFSDQLENQKANMIQEGKLIDSVLYWYILPPVIINIIFVLGFGEPSDYGWNPFLVRKLAEIMPITLTIKISYLLSTILFNVVIYFMNKRAVKKTVKPAINDIEKVLFQLKRM